MVATHKLLIIDDDATLRRRLRAALEANHWAVVEASNGADAAELAKQHAPDVVLLDVSLRDVHSDTVAKMLKLDPVTCTIPIVVLSAFERTEGQLEPWAAGALLPTTTIPSLLAKLKHILAKQKLHKPYVLVVDDEPDLVDILTAVLNDQGFAASGAANGCEALEAIRSAKPDAILLDLDMPQMNGWELLAQLRATTALRDIRVVILTGKDQAAEDRRRGLLLGASDYLLKPCEPTAIIRALQLALSAPPTTR